MEGTAFPLVSGTVADTNACVSLFELVVFEAAVFVELCTGFELVEFVLGPVVFVEAVPVVFVVNIALLVPLVPVVEEGLFVADPHPARTPIVVSATPAQTHLLYRFKMITSLLFTCR